MAKLEVAIVGKADQFLRELKKAESGTQKFGRAAHVVGGVLAGSLLVGLQKSARAAEGAEASTARLDQAFKDAGLSAKNFARPIDDAEAAGRKLGFTNDDVKESLGSLATATHSGAKSLDLLSEAEDLARFKHTDLEASTKMLTAAMAGNVRAAKQLGIVIPRDLTDPQQKAAFVLKAVEDRVHGQAKAFSDTASGGIAQFHAQTQNLEENLGKGLLPALTKIAEKLSGLAEFFSKHNTLAKAAVAVVGALTIASWALNSALLANPIGLVVVGLVALGTALVVAWEKSKTFRDIVTGTWDVLRGGAEAVIDFFKRDWPEIATLLSGPFAPLVALATDAFGIRSTLTNAFDTIKDDVSSAVSAVAGYVTALPSKIGDFSKGLASKFTGFFTGSGIGEWVKGKIGDFAGFIAALPGRIADFGSELLQKFTSIFTGAQIGQWLVERVAEFAGKFTELPGKIGDAIGGAMHFLKEKLGDLFSWKKIVGWIKDALGFASPSPHFMAIGHDIVDSMIRGVGESAGLLKDAVTNLAKKFIPSFSAPSGTGLVEGTGHLVGRVLNALNYARSHGWSGTVISGYRTYAEQAALYQRYLAGGPIAAPPGTSSHERGEAVDVSDAGRFDTIMAGAPRDSQLYNLVPGDFNHFSVTGYAKGGIATIPLIGEAGPEALIPLGTPIADRYLGGGDQILDVTVNLDGEAIYRNQKRYAARDSLRNGGTGIRS
jgi:hypothetical protein